jgi:hypothetical protein
VTTNVGADSVQANVCIANVKACRVSCGGPAEAKSSSPEIRRWLIGRELFEETK